MRAVVLVGGFGTRLRPLTLDTPKQMLPVVGKPMIEHVVGALAHHGITEVVLSLGYRPDAFIDAYPDGTCAGVSLRYAVEPEPLDTAGAIRFAALEAGIDETFVVLNGDVMTDLDVGALVDAHRGAHAEGTIALTPVDDPSRYGVVPIDAERRVIEFVEKPPAGEAPTNWINAGTYVLEPSVLDRIEPGRRVSIEREVFPAMVADGVLYGLQAEGYWVDAGTPETYLQVQLDLLDGRRGKPVEGIDPTATVDPSAQVERSVVGSHTRVGPGAVVKASVLADGVVIGAGARVSESIIGPHAEVGEHAVVDALSVIGPATKVTSGAVVSGQRLPADD